MQDTTNIPKKLSPSEINSALCTLDDKWRISDNEKELIKCFEFKGFYKTMGFVNALAWIAQSKMHHPDFQVSYNKCIVHFTTHDADGLTQNDFDCALAVDALKA